MPNNQEDVAQELNQFRQELVSLKKSVSGITERLAALEKGVNVTPEICRQEESSEYIKRSSEDKEWTRVGHEVLLPRIAAVCFMLVVALILRTVSENGMLDTKLGSYLGALYALALIGWGWILYGRADKLAPVFPACGVLLLYSIIYEANINFESLSIITTYSILLVTEIVVVAIGLRCRAVVLLYLSVLSSSVVGVALGFPEPFFAVLGLVLLVNNIAGHIAARRKISISLRWYTLFLSGLFWLLWTYKLNYSLNSAATNAQEIGLSWSMPILGLFYLFYLYSSLCQSRENAHKIGVFHGLMPVFNAAGTFWIVYFIAGPWLGERMIIGLGGVVVSGLYIALLFWLTRGGKYDFKGGKEYVAAATVLLISALPLVVPAIWAMPIWVAAAAILTVQSSKWQSGAVRLISYAFQLFIVVFAFKAVNYEKSEVPWLLGFFLAAAMGFVCIRLYRWCRKNRPDYDSIFFKAIDPHDLTAALLLLIGLLHLYSMFRFGAFALVEVFFAQTTYAFACSKSIIINMGAVTMMVVGLRTKAKELLIVSVPLVIIGALKVFLFDLFRGQGMPLVLSVFSFGVVAVVSSITMKKWGQKNN